MKTRTLVFAFAWVILSMCIALRVGDAQAPAKRENPRLVFETNQARTLAFSSDSRRLYSAGLDKFVHGWELRQFGRKIVRYDASLVQTLRWEISRGLRGGIYSMAASPVDRRLAIGGYGARHPSGDIVIFNTENGQIEHVLPKERPPGNDVFGHGRTISSLAFSPDGAQLASLSMDGELRVWSAPRWDSRLLAEKRKQAHRIQRLTFVGDGVLAVAIPRDEPGTTWNIALYNTRRPERPQTLDEIHRGNVTALSKDPKSPMWASADELGNIFLWDGARGARSRLLRNGRPVNDIAFGPGGTLFAATNRDVPRDRPALLEFWELEERRLLDATPVTMTEHVFACAVSPDEGWVVASGGEENAIVAFPLKDRDGELVPKPLSGGTRVEQGGRGRSVGRVAFATGGPPYTIGFGPIERPRAFNDYANIEQAFNLSNPRLLVRPPDGVRWRTPVDESGDWRVRKDLDGLTLDIDYGGEHTCTIQLDRKEQGQCRSYCWLGSGGKTHAIAVGTDYQNGIYIYRLMPRTRGRPSVCPLLRYFRDHTGWVTSLSVSPDGKYLVSGSADQTIKVWSLEGIGGWDDIIAAEARPFGLAELGWGGTFELRGGRIVLSTMREGGIVAQRGLHKDDEIVGVLDVAALWVRPGISDLLEAHLKPYAKPARAEQILDILKSTRLWQQRQVVVRRGREVFLSQAIVPAWTPMMTLFVSREGEWALATPQGPYDASPGGDELFGWHFNLGRDKTPEFHRGDHFRDELEQPDVIRNLLTVGNLRAAIRLAEGGDPAALKSIVDKLDGDRVVADLAENTPAITIQQPGDGQQFKKGDDIVVEAVVDYHRPGLVPRFTLGAYANGVPLGKPVSQRRLSDRPVDASKWIVQWRVSAVDKYNGVVVVADEKTNSASATYAIRHVHFRAEPPAGNPKLHILTLAARDYPKGMTLKFPVDDAKSIVASMQSGATTTVGDTQLYEPGIVVDTLVDHAITSDSIKREFAKFNNVSEGDLFIAFIAGHGIAVDNEYYFVPPHAKLAQLKTINEADLNDEAKSIIKEVGISWSMLSALAMRVPCRKLFMLDTCHSGIIVEEGLPDAELNAEIRTAESKRLPSHWKAAIRPLKEEQILVMSATAVGQSAVEYPGLKHGVFTKCLLDGFKGQADESKDEEVSFQEIVQYTEKAVLELTRRDYNQTPTSSPIYLVKLSYSVPLVRYLPRPLPKASP